MNIVEIVLLAMLAAIILALVLVIIESRRPRKGENPYSSILLDRRMKESLSTIQRIDRDGYLYHMDYLSDYYKPAVAGFFKLVYTIIRKSGCSAFVAYNDNLDFIMGRNYDYPHKDKNGNITGLNVALHTAPQGKFRSLAFADASWISLLGYSYHAGALDNGICNLTPLCLLPYLCVDGMNEKGLCVSILSLDLKEGEKPCRQMEAGKEKVNASVLLRYMLDGCADLEDCIELAKGCNMINTLGEDYHLFVSDHTGRSAVFEWRYDSLSITETDIVTNFYVGYDDAEDCYYGKDLKERFIRPKKTKKEYRYGYGHGYGRFRTLAEALDQRRDKRNRSRISEDDAMKLLKDVSQKYDGSLTSYTQYSVIYNAHELSADVCVGRNYRKAYSFKVKEDA